MAGGAVNWILSGPSENALEEPFFNLAFQKSEK